MSRALKTGVEDDVADLLEDAASVHEAEGRPGLAKHHRRAAARLRRTVQAA